MSKKQNTFWLLEGPGGWFVVKSKLKKRARAEGIQEYGRGNASIRIANDSEVESYLAQKGEIEEV